MEPETRAAFFRIADLDVLGRDARAQVGQIEIGIDSEVERSLVGRGTGRGAAGGRTNRGNPRKS